MRIRFNSDYLSKRFDRPLAWVLVLGVMMPVPLAAIGYSEKGLNGALEGAIAGLIVGTLGGLMIGGSIWIVCRLIGGLDRPIRWPDLWALHMRCTRCGWHTTPEGPWSVRDCMVWPDECPSCSGELVLVMPSCPRCGGGGLKGKTELRRFMSQIRVPRSLNQAVWGGYTCKECGCAYDKWGREVTG